MSVPSIAAEIVAVPIELAETVPLLETEATISSEDDQVAVKSASSGVGLTTKRKVAPSTKSRVVLDKVALVSSPFGLSLQATITKAARTNNNTFFIVLKFNI